MEARQRFDELFGDVDKPILGMLHLAGHDPVRRAINEARLLEDEGVTGVIVENYHGGPDDVERTLRILSTMETGLVVGVNILPNEFDVAIPLAHEYGAQFVQLDHVAGRYTRGELDIEGYNAVRKSFPDVTVVGGVWPKYYTPVPGSNLENDLRTGMERADAIVVTGEGTGKETPLDKIRSFREVLGPYPLLVGAGLTPENAGEQLSIADGAIVGSSLKVDSDTSQPIDRERVRALMSVVRERRK